MLRRVLTPLWLLRALQGAPVAASSWGLGATALVALALSLAVTADVVQAQDERDTATARALFEQGVELADKGDWAGAADRFERSDKLRHSPVVTYNLANAWVELGRLVEAAEVLRQIEKDPSAKPEVKKDARSLLVQLEPRIATLVVEVESRPPPDDVRVNDRPLPEAALGVPTPIDPGTVVVTVNDGGRVLWTKRVEVTAGGTERITITLPKQGAESAGAVPTPRETAEQSQAAEPSDGYEDDFKDDGDRAFYEEPWVWVGAGVLVAAGVVAAVLIASSGDEDGSSPTEIETPGTTRLTPGTITVGP